VNLILLEKGKRSRCVHSLKHLGGSNHIFEHELF